MARIAGVDIPDNKRGVISLTYIFGIGRSRAAQILEKANVDLDKKVRDWTDDESNAIRTIITESTKVEGVLKSEIQLNIKRLMDIGCYSGLRHRRGFLYVGRRQRTTPVPEKESVKPLRIRRKLLNNN